MASTAALLWCKSIIPVTLAGIALVTRAIVHRLSDVREDGDTAAFLSISSLCVMVPALIASQYDCLSLLFMLLGILFYSKNKHILFVLMFSIAVPLKLFAIFIFIPMLLIRYKNILKILGMLVGVMVPQFILELPFKGNIYYETAMGSQNGDAIELLLGSNITVSTIKINPFFVCYIIVCLLCYMAKYKDSVAETKTAVYYSFAVFAAFCTLIPIRSYWLILFTPFLAILVSLKKGNKTLAILADTAAGAGGGLFYLANHWIYNTGSIANQLILYGIIPEEGTEPKYWHFEGFLDAFGLWDMRYILFAVFVGTLVFCLWYLYPDRKKKDKDEKENGGKDHTFFAMLSRPAILLFVFALLMYCNFASMPAVKYGSTDYEIVSETNLIDELSMTRTIVFDSDETISQLTLHLDAYAYRSARALVGVKLTDTNSGIVMWEDAVGVAIIEDDIAEFDIGKLNVKAGHEYELEIYAISPELIADGYVYPYLDSEGNLAVTIR